MVVAYLRGWLKTSYPNGIKSKIREEMILSYLDMECRHDLAKAAADLKAHFVGLARNPTAFMDGVISDVVTSFRRVSGFREPAQGVTPDRVNAIQQWFEMAKAGLFDPSVTDAMGIKG